MAPNGTAPVPDLQTILTRVQSYRQADQDRDALLQTLAHNNFDLHTELGTLHSDLDDERNTRRAWKKRAEEAEAAVQRKFAAVLVDGDGYMFRKALYQAVVNSGGSKAANDLYTAVIDYLTAVGALTNHKSEYDVLVNVYANKSGLARTLVAAGYLDHHSQLDQFFCSFSQGRSLFQFIDCGPGKERADAKLRDTFHFYAYNAQCENIFLAVTHDNGYIAELDKYRYNTVVQPKVVLVHRSSTAQAVQAYANFPFRTTTFESVFEGSGLIVTPRMQTEPVIPVFEGAKVPWPAMSEGEAELTPPVSRTSSSISVPPGLAPVSASVRVSTVAKSPTPPAEMTKSMPAKGSGSVGTVDGKSGIPINRSGQRIDLKMRQPTAAELSQFETRIKSRKLCNEHHLRDNCESYRCLFDHQRIDDVMKNTLRYKARTIPCKEGSKCRIRDCFYGHVCPWGNNECGNPNCLFISKGLHDIRDLQVDRFVAAAPVAASTY